MPQRFEVITVGSALRDVTYYTDAFSVMKNPVRDVQRKELLCIEFGAKIRSNNVHFEFGGGAANAAVAFGRLGLRAGVITAVGDDFDGRAIIGNLKEQRVRTSLVAVRSRHRTGFSFVAVDEGSGEHTAFVYYGATQDVHVTKPLLRGVSTQWFYVSSLSTATWKSTMRTLLSSDARMAWNPGGTQLAAGFVALRPLFAKTDVLILNADEAAECLLSEGRVKPGTIQQMLKHIQAWGPEVVVITDSHRGSWAYDGERVYNVKNPHDTPVDTTGAGDSYGSSFVAGLIRYGGDIHRSMQLATVNATANVRVVGAQRGLLRWSDLPKRLKRVAQ
jgi:ribokinase